LNRLVLSLVVGLLLAGPAGAMFENQGLSVRAEGMGGAFTAFSDDVWAANSNPAGLAQVHGMTFSGAYKLLFGGVGVNLHAANAGFGMPVGRYGTAVISGQETGIALHSERTVRLSHGFRLARDLAFGYGLSGYNLYQQDVGSAYSFGLDLGMLARVYRVWSVGFFAHNINMPKMGTGDQGVMPWMLAFGLGFEPAPGIRSAVDVKKEPGQATRVCFGQELRIVRDFLTLRAGLQTEPIRFAAGFRTGYKNVQVDYSLRTHAELPLEHGLGVTVEF
jgi:hypothetical protein